MIATLINAAAIILGSLIGLLIRKGIKDEYRKVVFTAAGLTSLAIGIQMVLETDHILSFALALMVGGLLGTAFDVEGAIERLGDGLKKRFARRSEDTFATGFLNASVLFCAGAMTIVGSFNAGTVGDYSLLLTKSVLDGFVSIIFAGAMGIGVAFAALSVFVYQGALTLLSEYIKPYVSDLMLGELTAIGGALVIMIALGLLEIKSFKTGNFLPAMAVIIILVLAMPFITFL
ncbi:MAG TPA: DUF554 domain-containing protein [Rectinema sp.]|jgi:hypothetical protein|nr:DUF554 domain-containing protein [Spirochaetia bacterium]HNP92839.1 DUF554 domain-containing protein [Rectinema sp.]HNT58982.1 DUF554 domain-containing protein [Rectinema sp.]HNV36637.1 DUF554 domain-containing protein [Rectinema sp.]HNZ93275.1 DUF554 domain-containing protein [Rectinema sp.]